MNNNSNSSNSSSVIQKIKTPKVYFPFMFLIFCLILVLFFVIFKVKKNVESNVFIILFFTILIVGICIQFVPNFEAVKTLLGEINNIFYLIFYVIFLILFFNLMPENTLNDYAYIITPITMLLGAFMFYKSSTYNFNEKFNVNYERIKTLIMFFCMITIFIIYYNVDPGGLIQKYFGYSLLLTILITVFIFLYLIIVLTLPDKSANSGQKTNFFDNFRSVSTYGSIGFVLFILTIIIISSTSGADIFKDKYKLGTASILVLVICILWGILLFSNLFPEIYDSSIALNKINLFKRSLLVLFGIVLVALIVYWFSYNLHHLSSNSSIVSFVLNLLIIILVLGLIYKTIYVKIPVGNSNKNAFFSLITSFIFYIPCIFSGIFDSAGKIIAGEYYGSDAGSLMMLILAIILLVGYYEMPSLFNTINIQGGKQLLNKPVYTDSLYSLGTYQELNGSDTFDYQYAISFWVFLDSAAPNTSASYSKYTSLLNFGNKPNVLYNGEKHTLMVTMQQKDLKKINKNHLIDFDENGNRILYKNENMLLQKWNNIIINYSGGVLDIFLNGELVKSDKNVVPYYNYDNLTIGEDGGIKGGICNVVYFNKPLTSSNIYYLYNMVKTKTPPVLNESNKTIVRQNMETVTKASKTVIQ
jgi:hypothetical protein